MADILVSYVVTVYNKAPYVGFTAQSLIQQEGGITCEYIFVDDVSTDRSLQVIEEHTRGIANVTIIRNPTNAGPSIRFNQGALLARGKYLQFMDSDDILAANATSLMLALAEKHQAEFVHGFWSRTEIESAKLVGQRAQENGRVTVSYKPFELVFKERFRRMSQLMRRETYMAAGGCDERVFVPDESLPLRMARVSKCFVHVDTPVLLIPKVEGELSENTAQLNHDRFMANYNLITDFPDLEETARRLCYQRCISATWKEIRDRQGLTRAVWLPAFRAYLGSGFGLQSVDLRKLDAMRKHFDAITGVRRPPMLSGSASATALA